MNIRRLNWIVIQNLNRVFKTSIFDEMYWRHRNCRGDWGKEYKDYSESVSHSHRKKIIDILNKFSEHHKNVFVAISEVINKLQSIQMGL